MVLVFGLVAQSYKHHYYDVGEKVRQRVYSIGNHGCRSAHDACHKFEDEQHRVYHATFQRNAVDGALSIGVVSAVRISLVVVAVLGCIVYRFHVFISPFHSLAGRVMRSKLQSYAFSQ